MIHLIATVEVKPGKRADYLREFHRIVPKVKAEPGCIEYGAAVDARTDIDMQIPRRENVVTLVEKWESVEALKVHLTVPHVGEFFERTGDLTVAASVQILDPA